MIVKIKFNKFEKYKKNVQKKKWKVEENKKLNTDSRD